MAKRSSLNNRQWYVLKLLNAEEETIRTLVTPWDLDYACETASTLLEQQPIASIAIHAFDPRERFIVPNPLKILSLDDEDATECNPRSGRTR